MSAPFASRLRRWRHNATKSSRSVRPISLNLETLEKRTVPAILSAMRPLQPAPNDVYLATLYQGELQRPIDSTGLGYWRSVVQEPNGLTQAAEGILNSNEYFNREVWTDYGSLLGRDPDPQGWLTFMHALQNGATPQEVKASILGSDEFFSRVGSDADSFLNALYGEELGRPVDASGSDHWTPLTGDAAGRTEVARLVEASPEATQRFVNTLYQDTLGRAPDAGGMAYWSGQLQQGVSQSSVTAGVLGSDEFFHRMEVYIAGANTRDPNAAAAKFIADAHLFASQPAVVPAGQGTTIVTSGNGSGDTSGDTSTSTDTQTFVDNSQVDNSVVDNSVTDNSVVDNSVTDNSTTDTSWTDNSSCDTSTIDNSNCDNSTIDNSGYDNSSYDNSSYDNSTVDNSTTDNATVDNSVVDTSMVDNSIADPQPVIDNSVADTTSYAPPDNSTYSTPDYTAYSVDSGTQDTSAYSYDTTFVDTSFDPNAGY
jgi:hypothetical protein